MQSQEQIYDNLVSGDVINALVISRYVVYNFKRALLYWLEIVATQEAE